MTGEGLIPTELYMPVDMADVAAGVAASIGYAGANAVITISNNGGKVGWIPRGAIVIGSEQVTETVVYQVYSGADPATEIPIHYQVSDANLSYALALRRIVLKPGERLRIRTFNRAPAAAANVTVSLSAYEMEARVYDQVLSRKRAAFESEVR